MALDRLRREIAGLYEEHGPALLRYARAVSKSADLARDAVQEAFLRYQAQRAAGSVISAPRPWLYKVVFNVIMDGTGEPNVPLDEASAAQDPAFGPHEYAEASALENRFEQILSPRELSAVRLRSEGLSYDEIAYALGTPDWYRRGHALEAVVKIKRAHGGVEMMRTAFRSIFRVLLRKHPPADILQAYIDRECTGLANRLVRAHVLRCEAAAEKYRKLQVFWKCLQCQMLRRTRWWF